MSRCGQKTNVKIDECSSREKKVLDELLLDFIVEENVPFSVCGHRGVFPRPLGRMFSFLRPGYKMPSMSSVKGPMLEKYCRDVQNEVKRLLKHTEFSV